MSERVLEITNDEGLHLRPAAELVKLAARFSARVTLERDGKEINAKSVLHVQSLGVRKGMEVTIRAEGEDEDEALEALSSLVASGFAS